MCGEAPHLPLQMGIAWLIAALRVANAIVLSTYFVPDEFWQHGEAAHWRAFAFGDLCVRRPPELRCCS